MSPNHHGKTIPFIRQQRVLFNQLNEDGDEFNSKEAQLLVSILGVLSQQLDPSSDQVTARLGWTCYTWYYLKLALIMFVSAV